MYASGSRWKRRAAVSAAPASPGCSVIWPRNVSFPVVPAWNAVYRNPNDAQMSAHTTRPRTAATPSRTIHCRARLVNSIARPRNETTRGLPPIDRTASITIPTGIRIGPDSFDRNAPASSTAAPPTVAGVTRCTTVHIAPVAAVKNSAAAMSDVTSAPCARSVGENVNSRSATHAPAGDTSRLAHP